MKNLFEYKTITSDYIGARFYNTKYGLMVASAITFSIYFIEGSINEIVHIMLGKAFLAAGLFMHFTYKPFDKIYINNKNLIINKIGQPTKNIPIENIESFKSDSSLKIRLKSGEGYKLSYSNWMMPRKKVNELNNALNKLLSK